MSLTLYTAYLNSAGHRVRIALALKDIPYTYVSVFQIGKPAYRHINPQGLMPALKIGEHIVPQATAILEYLEETHRDPTLLPRDPVLRARARGFAQAITSEMHAVDVIRIRRFLHNDLALDQTAIDQWQRHWFAQGFDALEELLRRRETPWPYSFGNTPSWADLHLIPQVHKGIARFDVDMAPWPLINAIYHRAQDHRAFIAAMPEQQPDWPGAIAEPEVATR